MTQKLTTIGHRVTFNNEQSPYRTVSYKRPRNDKYITHTGPSVDNSSVGGPFKVLNMLQFSTDAEWT